MIQFIRTSISRIDLKVNLLGLTGSIALVLSTPSSAEELQGLSMEELAGIPVIKSAKEDQNLFDAPAGSFVFDESRIENLPVDSIPEMLRYAPGVHIMRPSNGTWGIGIRGMNSRLFSRSLFSVDDQSVYGAVFGGLWGNQHDLLLDDIASIEVAYGPGGSLWGTNAANGRVNVVTKSAFETQDSVINVSAGNQNRAVSGRIGWAVGDNAAARVYAKSSKRLSSDADEFEDDWTSNRTGFQYDVRPNHNDLFSISGEYYKSELGYKRSLPDLTTGFVTDLVDEEILDGFNLQSKWTHQSDENNGFTLRAWGGETSMRSEQLKYDFTSVGLELRSQRQLGERHRITTTAGTLLSSEKLIDSAIIRFKDDYPEDILTTHAGAEYVYSIVPNELEASIGISGHHYSETDEANWLPTARLLYHLNEKDRLWVSVSSSDHASPSAINQIEYMLFGVTELPPITIETPFSTLVVDKQIAISNGQNISDTENLTSFEIGYRHQMSKSSSLNINAYYNSYDNVVGATFITSYPVFTVAQPYFLSVGGIDNISDGYSYGFDSSLAWNITPSTLLQINYSFIEDSFERMGDIVGSPEQIAFLDGEIHDLENNVPTHMASIWLNKDFTQKWNANLGLRFSSSFEKQYVEQESIFQADLRVSWKPNDRTRLSLVGRNLLDERTSESALRYSIGDPTEQKREFYLELTHKF